MKKLKSNSIYITILLMALTLFPVGAFAKEYQVKDVPNVLLKDARQRVSDPEFQRYYDLKYHEVNRGQHKRALALTARKLVRLVFRLLKDNRLYNRW